MADERTEAPTFVDCHFHFDLYKDSSELLSEIEARRVRTIAVTNAPSVFHYTLKMSQASAFLFPAVGLHPELVSSHAHELDAMWPMLDQTRFVGEIGLDYVTGDPKNRRAQRGVFDQILERCAAYGDKILSIHSRRSASDVISAIGDGFPGKVILHWFSGSHRDLERAVAFGFYFSVGPAMVKSKNGRAHLSSMPKDRVLTETDGPFVQSEGQPARPPDVDLVIREMSQLWGRSMNEIKSLVSQTFDTLVGQG